MLTSIYKRKDFLTLLQREDGESRWTGDRHHLLKGGGTPRRGLPKKETLEEGQPEIETQKGGLPQHAEGGVSPEKLKETSRAKES